MQTDLFCLADALFWKLTASPWFPLAGGQTGALGNGRLFKFEKATPASPRLRP